MLKIAVFGVGRLGKLHLNNWKDIPGTEVVGFYEPDDNTAAEIVEKYHLKRFTDPDKLMDKCDAVDIASPTPTHFGLCEKAIKKSKHVFVEKPLAHTMDEARQLVNLVQESNIKLQVGHVERFNPAFLAVKDIALNPLFVEVHRHAPFNPNSTEINVIFDLMIDDIDILLSIVPSDVKSIAASGVGLLMDTPDIANVRIEFHNGCVANLTASRISLKEKQKMRLYQKDAYIGIDFLNKKTEVMRLKEPIAMTNPVVPDLNAVKRELEEFKLAIENNTRTLVSERDGLVAMDVAHQVLARIGNNIN